MSYSTANPPRLLMQAIAGQRLWYYESADAAATVDGSGYFSNGHDLGMRNKDQIIVFDTTNSITTWHRVAVTGTTIDLGDGTTVGSATNSD
jgi:hypothetical protein